LNLLYCSPLILLGTILCVLVIFSYLTIILSYQPKEIIVMKSIPLVLIISLSLTQYLFSDDQYHGLNSDFTFKKLTDADILSVPLPLPYDGKVITEEGLDVLIDHSIGASKQPVIIFGANWCPDCRILEGTLNLPTIKKFNAERFEIIHIDVGRYDQNMSLMKKLRIESKIGIPRVVILDLSRNHQNTASTSEWTTARDRKQQEIFNYFQRFAIK